MLPIIDNSIHYTKYRGDEVSQTKVQSYSLDLERTNSPLKGYK